MSDEAKQSNLNKKPLEHKHLSPLAEKTMSAFLRVPDSYPMPSKSLGIPPVATRLYNGSAYADKVSDELYRRYDVKGDYVMPTALASLSGLRRSPTSTATISQLTVRLFLMKDDCLSVAITLRIWCTGLPMRDASAMRRSRIC